MTDRFPSKEQILDALRQVPGPHAGTDVVSAGMVSGLVVRADEAGFVLDLPANTAPATAEVVRAAAQRAVQAVPGIRRVSIVATAERDRDAAPAAASAPPPAAGPRPDAKAAAPSDAGAEGSGLSGVNAIVAVASGKGGVGKSTVSVNLALALAALGLRVGLLDADIYGPSLPRMLGLSGRPGSDGKRIRPMEAYGLKTMSIGLLVDTDTAVIWRGPMATGALNQMLTDVSWGALDVLVVDMPPGTGDIQLTLAQRVPLAGAVIVSTPQDIALIDARKAIDMFRRVDVPILGLVENMSQFICPHCGGRSDIFGHGGARETARALDVPFLGEIPLHLAIRQTSDEGKPVVACQIASPQAEAFLAIAHALTASLGGAPRHSAPAIGMA